MKILMQLSDTIAKLEQARASTIENAEKLRVLSGLMEEGLKDTGPGAQRWLANRIPPEIAPVRDGLASILTRFGEPVDQELLSAGSDITGAQLLRLLELSYHAVRREHSDQATKIVDGEQTLRGILQLIADATDEEE